MRRRRRIPVRKVGGRFFVDARIGMVSSETRFSQPVGALIDTGAQVTVLPSQVFDGLQNHMINLQFVKRITITTPFGEIPAREYRGQIGLCLDSRSMLLAEHFTGFAVPEAIDNDQVCRDDHNPYIILGKDALATFSSRIRARYWIIPRGMVAADTLDMRCSMSACGKRVTRP